MVMMRKTLSLLLCTLLTLSSCSTGTRNYLEESARAPSSNLTCTEHAKAFLNNDKSPMPASIFNQKLRLEVSTDELASFLFHFSDMDLKKLSDDQIDMMRALYLFSGNDKKILPELVIEFKKFISGKAADPTNKDWPRFIKHKSKVEKYSLKKLMPKEQSLIYEKLYYSCRAQTQKTPSSAELKRAIRARTDMPTIVCGDWPVCPLT